MSGTILRSEPLSRPWQGIDPFLFAAHHQDDYPASDGKQGVPEAHLKGRQIGNDFARLNGFNMYHGDRIPGFPAHPHRGFETVTIVDEGLVDHADSLGATARYGDGDVQWLTAGSGVMHSEMFPLRSSSESNPLRLFQIWLNLPAKDKMTPPAFAMLWAPDIPVYQHANAEGRAATVRVIAGAYAPQEFEAALIIPPPATPNSWAGNPASDLAIWQITLEPGAGLALPPARLAEARRALYFHGGDQLEIAGQTQTAGRMIEVIGNRPLNLVNTGREKAEILLLQAVPLKEPVAAYGPFVMNSNAEIDQAMRDFRQTQFGGWPWHANGPVNESGKTRFAIYPGASQPEFPPEN